MTHSIEPLSISLAERNLITPEMVSAHGLVLVEGVPDDPALISGIADQLGKQQRHIHGGFRLPGFPELVRISNQVGSEGEPLGIHNSGEVEWHIDSSWSQVPNGYSAMYCERSTGDSGATWFTRLDDAHDRLPTILQEWIRGLTATHSLEAVNEAKRALDPKRTPLSDEQRAAAPPVEHPLVFTHPVTGRQCLRIGSMVISRINELEPDESTALLNTLLNETTSPDHIYAHTWRAGELVIWDNLALLHTATPTAPGDIRNLYRATID